LFKTGLVSDQIIFAMTDEFVRLFPLSMESKTLDYLYAIDGKKEKELFSLVKNYQWKRKK
jgi:hypothetical protein